jgi:hypothetical protein
MTSLLLFSTLDVGRLCRDFVILQDFCRQTELGSRGMNEVSYIGSSPLLHRGLFSALIDSGRYKLHSLLNPCREGGPPRVCAVNDITPIKIGYMQIQASGIAWFKLKLSNAACKATLDSVLADLGPIAGCTCNVWSRMWSAAMQPLRYYSHEDSGL